MRRFTILLSGLVLVGFLALALGCEGGSTEAGAEADTGGDTEAATTPPATQSDG